MTGDYQADQLLGTWRVLIRPAASLLFACLVLSCGALTTPAQAALISLDDPVFGVGAVTLDTGSGLEWLDLTFTDGLSFNAVSAQLSPGGTYHGFRYGTELEVRTLYSGAGLPFSGGVDPTGGDATMFLMNLLGLTASDASCSVDLFVPYCETSGITGTRVNTDPSSGHHVLSLSIQGTPLAIFSSTTQLDTAADHQFGSFLVRSVDEPSSLALMVTALLALHMCAWLRPLGPHARVHPNLPLVEP